MNPSRCGAREPRHNAGQTTEQCVQQKLPLLRVIRQTFDTLGDHGGQMLAQAPQLLALMFAGTCLSMYLSHLALVEHSMLLDAAGWLVVVAAPVLAAVGWHRRILLNETPRAGFAAGKPERMYFLLAVATSVGLFVLATLQLFVYVLTTGPEGTSSLGKLLALGLWLVPLYFIGHLFLALPEAALTGKVNLRRIHAMTRGNKLRFVVVGLLPIPILLLLELVRIYLLQMPRTLSPGFYVYNAISMLVGSLITVTSMSVCYRVLVLQSEVQARDAAPGTAVSNEG